MDGVYAAFLALCTPFKLAEPWAFVSADRQAFRGPVDPSAALSTLRAAFDDGALIEAAIATRDASGGLQIHPSLSVASSPIVALRNRQSRHVDNLMTDWGCVRGCRYPMFSILSDFHTCDAHAAAYTELILTATIDDTILLRSLGFPAAPIVGVSKLDDAGLVLFGRFFGARRRASEHGHASKCRPTSEAEARRKYGIPDIYPLPRCHGRGPKDEKFVVIAIAMWSPTSVSTEVHENVQEALQYLADLGQNLDVNLYDLQHWTLEISDLKRIELGVSRREPSWVKNALFTSFDKPNRELTSLLRPAIQPPDMCTAYHEMQQAFLATGDALESGKRRTAAIAAHRTAVERELITPMTRQAQKIADPFDRTMHLHYVDLCMLFGEQMLAVRQQSFAARQPNGQNADAAANKQRMSELLALSKQLLTLAPRLQRCTTTNNLPPTASNRTLTGQPRPSGNSGLGRKK